MRCDWVSEKDLFTGQSLLGAGFYRKTLAAFLTAAGEHFAAVLGFHTLTVSVRLDALLFAGLPGTFHWKNLSTVFQLVAWPYVSSALSTSCYRIKRSGSQND